MLLQLSASISRSKLMITGTLKDKVRLQYGCLTMAKAIDVRSNIYNSYDLKQCFMLNSHQFTQATRYRESILNDTLVLTR